MEGMESIFTLDANHMDMCKYPNKNSDGYRKVSGELQRLCESIRKAEQIRLEEGDDATETDRRAQGKPLRVSLSTLKYTNSKLILAVRTINEGQKYYTMISS